jgi:hypothetical protein
MKYITILFCVFAAGVGITVATIAMFKPGRLFAIRGSYNSTPFTLDAFEKINRELPEIVDDRAISFAVIPISDGYEIVGWDSGLGARFERTKWDHLVSLIDARMEDLRNESAKAESGPRE